MEIAPVQLDRSSAINKALRLIGVQARQKNQALEVTIEPDVPPLDADERALQQIIFNLASNAIKFTPEGGRITVRAERADDDGFQIVCEDSGRGIPNDKFASLFSPFSRIDNRFDRQEGGSGLGLSLVRGLVELHGGYVWLESEYGSGTRACVVLPSKQHDAAGGLVAV